MKAIKFSWQTVIMWVGDILTLVIITLIGFRSHNEINAGISRMLATLIPLLAAWYFVAYPGGLLKVDLSSSYRNLWQVVWAMVLVGPLAAVLRGFWLNVPVVPVFAVVLGGTGALGMLAWRAIFGLWLSRARFN